MFWQIKNTYKFWKASVSVPYELCQYTMNIVELMDSGSVHTHIGAYTFIVVKQ